MESSEISAKRMMHFDLICRICGDVARGMNFDVITCISCKSFFRRNALRPVGTLQCRRKFDCKITRETRISCAACRLKKCFAFGMNPRLIRSFAQHQMVYDNVRQLMTTNDQQAQLPTPRPLGLLRNDRSTLTTEQWNLFSNIIHTYDQQNVITNIRCIVAERSSLPIKLRVKPSSVVDYLYYCSTPTQVLLKQSPYFHSLSINARRTLIKHNVSLTSSFNATFIAREIDLWSNSDFEMSYDTLFGPDFLSKCGTVPKRMDSNSTLLKIMLSIVAFASNYSIVTWDSSQGNETIWNSIDLIKIQDVFVTLLWKYLVYQYGFKEAVLRYSSLIKTLLDHLYVIEEVADNEVYQQILDTIVLQTERLLIIDD